MHSEACASMIRKTRWGGDGVRTQARTMSVMTQHMKAHTRPGIAGRHKSCEDGGSRQVMTVVASAFAEPVKHGPSRKHAVWQEGGRVICLVVVPARRVVSNSPPCDVVPKRYASGARGHIRNVAERATAGALSDDGTGVSGDTHGCC